MAITYKSIPKVKFPVFILPRDGWYSRDGILFLESFIIDDTNMPGNSLGLRRLQTPHENLLPIKRSVNDLPALLKQKSKFFIDSSGAVFSYEKTIYCSLKYYRIKEIVKQETSSLLKIQGINSPFIIIRPPEPDRYWVGILHLGTLPWMIYEYSRHKKPDTRRKV